ALKITKALNPVARILVDENLQKTLKNEGRSPTSKNKGFSITETTLLVLADLDDPDQVQQALQVVLDDYLNTNQTQKLVEHIQAGNPAETFGTVKPESKPKVNHSASHASESPAGEGHQTPTHPHSSPINNSEISPTAEVIGDNPAKAEAPSETDKALWQSILGISFIKQLKKKVQKGEPLTRSEKTFAFLYRFYESFLKPAGKLLKKGFHWGWDKWRNIGGKKYQTLFEIVGFLLIASFLTWSVITVVHTILIPVHWIERKIETVFHHVDTTPAQTAAQTTSANGNNNGQLAQSNLAPQHSFPLTSNSKKQAPVSSVPIAVTAWNPSDESQADLDFEIAAVSKQTRIKPFAFEPNILDAAIAGQRLQDLQDPDKYTLRRGRETDKVLGVNLLSTNLVVSFKSSDALGGFVDGSNKTSFYWEDVKTIHVNQLVSAGVTLYQCGVIADGMKEPFTLQCPRAEDLKHLISALEFWIKTSQGHYAPLTGMPYLNQGLVLNNDCVVDKLWADSPAWNAVSYIETAQPNRVAQLEASQQVKAGVALGDHLWSIGKVTPEKQERNDLEAGLQTLPVTFFVVPHAEWEKAMTARNQNRANSFRPKLKKVVLSL
ncbi:MAG TPA: hypothetical protein VN963_10775, partial [bacterium]|nr:hypothetical protein [bacterium]